LTNPFQMVSVLNHELSLENCQRIFFDAARSAPRHTLDPQGLLQHLRGIECLYGSEVYLLHPYEIQQMFHGITLPVYQTVKRLFCTPLFRTHQTIWQILEAWAREVNATIPTAEAVWALCEYLRTDRDEQFSPRIEQTEVQWYIGVMRLETLIQRQGNTPTTPSFVCVVSDVPEHVLAFRRYDEGVRTNEIIAQTLYEALISQRRPEMLAPSGLAWRVPATLASAIPLPSDVQHCCASLQLPIEAAKTSPALMSDLHGTWIRSLAGRTIAEEWFEAILDNYLEKRHGHGPRKARDDADYIYRHLRGYNRDPALVIPALRNLLTLEQTTVRDDGTITAAGRQYADPLLASWRGHPVDVRRSRHDPSQVYVYLDGAILCQAQELRESAESENPLSPSNR
jgi:hypothetical protein